MILRLRESDEGRKSCTEEKRGKEKEKEKRDRKEMERVVYNIVIVFEKLIIISILSNKTGQIVRWIDRKGVDKYR